MTESHAQHHVREITQAIERLVQEVASQTLDESKKYADDLQRGARKTGLPFHLDISRHSRDVQTALANLVREIPITADAEPAGEPVEDPTL